MQGSEEGGVEQIDLLLDQTQRDLESIQDRLAPLLEEQARAEARLKLLKEIRSTYQVHVPLGISSEADIERSANRSGV